jgi:hypothetical protein
MKPTKAPAFYENLVPNSYAKASALQYEEIQSGDVDLENSETFKETKFCTIELEKLEQYLQYIKAEMTKQKVRVAGVKFSFAKYIHEPTDPKSNPLYNDRMTVIVGPVDLLSLAEGNLEGVEQPVESTAMDLLPRLNYMNITPPYGYTVQIEKHEK